MGTHPIFESDFDCLTDLNRLNKKMPAAAQPAQAVQVYGRKKTANAVATCKSGKGLIKVNGKPLEQIEPKALQFKLQEPLLVVGKEKFAGVDIRIRVSGGGRIAQVYAIRQAVARVSLPTTRSMLTSNRSRRSRICSSRMIVPSSSRIPVARSQRNSAVPVLARVTKNRTVKSGTISTLSFSYF